MIELGFSKDQKLVLEDSLTAKHLLSKMTLLNIYNSYINSYINIIEKTGATGVVVQKTIKFDLENIEFGGDTKFKALINKQEIDELNRLGLINIYELKSIPTLDQGLIDNARTQILAGLALSTTSMLLLPLAPLSIAIANKLIVSGIEDIIIALVNDNEHFDREKYNSQKALSYATFFITLGLDQISKISALCDKITQNCRSVFGTLKFVENGIVDQVLKISITHLARQIPCLKLIMPTLNIYNTIVSGDMNIENCLKITKDLAEFPLPTEIKNIISSCQQVGRLYQYISNVENFTLADIHDMIKVIEPTGIKELDNVLKFYSTTANFYQVIKHEAENDIIKCLPITGIAAIDNTARAYNKFFSFYKAVNKSQNINELLHNLPDTDIKLVDDIKNYSRKFINICQAIESWHISHQPSEAFSLLQELSEALAKFLPQVNYKELSSIISCIEYSLKFHSKPSGGSLFTIEEEDEEDNEEERAYESSLRQRGDKFNLDNSENLPKNISVPSNSTITPKLSSKSNDPDISMLPSEHQRVLEKMVWDIDQHVKRVVREKIEPLEHRLFSGTKEQIKTSNTITTNQKSTLRICTEYLIDERKKLEKESPTVTLIIEYGIHYFQLILEAVLSAVTKRSILGTSAAIMVAIQDLVPKLERLLLRQLSSEEKKEKFTEECSILSKQWAVNIVPHPDFPDSSDEGVITLPDKEVKLITEVLTEIVVPVGEFIVAAANIIGDTRSLCRAAKIGEQYKFFKTLLKFNSKIKKTTSKDIEQAMKKHPFPPQSDKATTLVHDKHNKPIHSSLKKSYDSQELVNSVLECLLAKPPNPTKNNPQADCYEIFTDSNINLAGDNNLE